MRTLEFALPFMVPNYLSKCLDGNLQYDALKILFEATVTVIHAIGIILKRNETDPNEMLGSCYVPHTANHTKVLITLHQLHEQCWPVLVLLYIAAFVAGLITAICGLLYCYHRRKATGSKRLASHARVKRGREKVQLLWSRRLSFSSTNDDFTIIKYSVSHPLDISTNITPSQNNRTGTENPSLCDEAGGLILSPDTGDQLSLSGKDEQSDKHSCNTERFEERDFVKDAISERNNINEFNVENDLHSDKTSTKPNINEIKLNNSLTPPMGDKNVTRVSRVKLKEERENRKLRSPILFKRLTSAGKDPVNKDLALFEKTQQKSNCSPYIKRLKEVYEGDVSTADQHRKQSDEEHVPTECQHSTVIRNHSYIEFLPSETESQKYIRIDGTLYKTKRCQYTKAQID